MTLFSGSCPEIIGEFWATALRDVRQIHEKMTAVRTADEAIFIE